MDTREVRDLLAAWAALSVAFANLLGDLFNPVLFGVAVVTVGTGFFLHELAHRTIARSYGLSAEFVAFYKYLAFAVLLSFAGFIFAAPGAVYTRGHRTGQQQLLISVGGPVTNIVLALLFLPVMLFFTEGVLALIGRIGFTVNAWLAAFNMLPVAGLDGQSVLRHSKPVYAAVMGVAVVLTVVSFLL